MDASHILREEMSSHYDNSYGENGSIDDEGIDSESNIFEFDADVTERDSIRSDGYKSRIDPSAHETSRFDDRYRIKPDPQDADDKPDPFKEIEKGDPYNEENTRSISEESQYQNYDYDYDRDYDVEHQSMSYRTFGFDDESRKELSSFEDEKTFGENPSTSRGDNGIEIEEIIEFDSVPSNQSDVSNSDGFDDELKEESSATVKTSRERRIITFLSGFVCCLIFFLVVAIAVGTALLVTRKKQVETNPPSSAPISRIITSSPTTLAPIPEPSFSPTRQTLDTGSPTYLPTEEITETPTKAPVNEPSPVDTSETNSPVNDPSPIGEPVTDPPFDEPSPIGEPATNAPVNEVSPVDEPVTTPTDIEPSPTGGSPGDPTSSGTENTELLTFLIANSIDGGEAVIQDGTPQNKAYKWLSTNAFLSIYPDEQILTRYSLATFFYATNGPSTWDSSIRENGWLTNAPECEWGSTANNQCTKGKYTSLTLDFIGVSGTIPQELGLLTDLERLSVRGSIGAADIISGTIPEIFGSLSNIQTIRLNDNDFTGMIPLSFGSMEDCIVLILSGNSLIGKIPLELVRTRGRTLNLANNQLSGNIPSELFALTELNVLNLHNNNLSGTIPTEIGNARSISTINFSNNQLGGPIPSEIGNLFGIRSSINFSSNKLSGTIPSEVGRLNKIRNFEVQNNLLAGSIPTQLSGLKSIELFRIDGNFGIIGSIPGSVCDTFGNTAISYSDCSLESFECECCTYCCEGGICECNILDADICGGDLTGARVPFL